MSWRALALGLVAVAAALPGCGTGKAADLFLIQRTGSIPGAKLQLLVSDDGYVQCNGGERKRMTDDDLLNAREIARDLSGPATNDLTLPSGRASVLSYRVGLEQGVIRFSDSSPRQPPALPKLQEVTRQIAKRVCGLAR